MWMAAENLFQELAVGTLLAVASVIIHGLGLLALSKLVRLETHEEGSRHMTPVSPRGFLVTIAVVLGLFVLHGVEIWLYALAYLALGAIADFSTALYFSTITYAAIGFDAEPLDPAWRMVAGIEGFNGLILIGWSTAFFVTVMGRIRRL
jgi:hypothetical protein